MSERHLEWLIMTTGPCAAAERRVSNVGVSEKPSKPGKVCIFEITSLRFSKSSRCRTTARPNLSIPVPASGLSLSSITVLGEIEVVSVSSSLLTALSSSAKVWVNFKLVNRGTQAMQLRPD